MQPAIEGYYTCVYDYNIKDLTTEHLSAYMEILPQYEFYFDQDYAEETGSIWYSYNNDQALITISRNDTITRLIVGVQMNIGDVSYHDEYRDVPNLGSIVHEYKFINKKISNSLVSYQYDYKNQSLDLILKYVDLLRSLGYVDANNAYGGINLNNKNVHVALYTDEAKNILYVDIDQLVAITPNSNSNQSTIPPQPQRGYPSEGQSATDYYISTEYLPNNSINNNVESQSRVAYESALDAINTKYDAMIDALHSSYQSTISGGYGTSQAMTALSQQIQRYEQQYELEIAELNSKYGY